MNNDFIVDTVTYRQLLEAMQEYTQMHSEEVPFMGLTLDLNHAVYENAEAAGHARFYVAFQGRNPVAYMSIFASELSQHKGIMCAVTDAFYVVPKYRSSGIFAKLLAYVEQDIKSAGIDYLTVGFNPAYNDKASNALLLAGYMASEVSYTKEV